MSVVVSRCFFPLWAFTMKMPRYQALEPFSWFFSWFSVGCLSRRWLFRALLGWLTLFISLSASVSHAAQVSGLYRQDVPVSGQGKKEQSEAMEQALAEVLVKVSGQREVLANTGIRSALGKPESYIREYGFRTGETATGRQQYLQATFDSKAVNRLLQTSGVAIWGQNRPATLVWLAVEHNGRRELLNTRDELPQVVTEVFRGRALPVVFPLMDFEDATAISPVDVWGGFSGKVREASARYGSDVILTGRLLQVGARYSGHLTLLFRGQSYPASIDNQDSAGIARKASDLVGDTLSRHYAVSASDENNTALLVVDNVTTVEDYAALSRYLSKLTAVREVSVHKIKGSRLEIELAIDGTVNQLADALALGRTLRAVNGAGAGSLSPGMNQAVLYYHWVNR